MSAGVHSNLILNASEVPYISCSKCEGMMVISLIEPVSDGFEIRSYRCDECEIEEQFVTAI